MAQTTSKDLAGFQFHYYLSTYITAHQDANSVDQLAQELMEHILAHVTEQYQMLNHISIAERIHSLQENWFNRSQPRQSFIDCAHHRSADHNKACL